MTLPVKTLFMALALLVALPPAKAGAEARPTKPRVLVIHSYAPDFSWTRDMQLGIDSVLRAPEVQAAFRVEFMDAKHIDTPGYRERLLALYREKYAAERTELLSTLGEVIETRSHETANHVQRVAAYAALLAQKLGLPQEEADLLAAASPMHDIGKIGIPDAILHKEGKLTPGEHDIIKHHTVIGHKILHASERALMSRACVIALQHHERWDGTGYPCGLKGEEIDLTARIIALVDVYDALSLDRVYKKAWPQHKVLEFLRQQRGLMFDPALVDLFFENLDELDAIRLRLSDPSGSPALDANMAGPPPCPLSRA